MNNRFFENARDSRCDLAVLPQRGITWASPQKGLCVPSATPASFLHEAKWFDFALQLATLGTHDFRWEFEYQPVGDDAITNGGLLYWCIDSVMPYAPVSMV